MGKKLPLFLAAVLLAGCAGAASGSGSQPPPGQSAARSAPEEDNTQGEIFVDDPASPYPMAVESWSVDLDGDGVEELVELRAEKGYFGNKTEPDHWSEWYV